MTNSGRPTSRNYTHRLELTSPKLSRKVVYYYNSEIRARRDGEHCVYVGEWTGYEVIAR